MEQASVEGTKCVVLEPVKCSSVFLSKSEERNFALIVEGTSIWVSREVLAMYSTVFKKMFYGDFAESRKDTVELPGKTVEEIVELLGCLFFTPHRKKVDDDNIFTMLKLSDEYDVEDLKHRCKRFLDTEIKKFKAGDKQVLLFTEYFARYGYKELLRICIPFAATLPIEVINAHRHELPSSIVASIFEAKSRRLQFEAKRHNVHCLAVKCTCTYCNANQAYTCRTCTRKVCSKCAEKMCGGFHRSECPNNESMSYDKTSCLCGYDFDLNLLYLNH